MSNIFFNIVVPATNGVGAAVDVSTSGALKTFTLTGNMAAVTATVTIEASLDGGTTWVPVWTTATSDQKTLSVACNRLRARVRNATGAVVANADVGSNDDGTVVGAIAVPAGNGVGASLDVSALGTFNTFSCTGTFTGSVTVEGSQDNINWTSIGAFTSPGSFSLEVVTQFVRVRRANVDGYAPGTPVVNVAAANDVAAGSGGTIDIGLNNVMDFGATGDGVTDDTAAINAAIADALATGVAGIWFPAGVYACTRQGGTLASFDINGVTDFMIMGRGGKSRVLMTGDGASGTWSMFRVRNGSENILFQNLVLDGNVGVITNPGTETHLINVEGGTGVTSRVRIQNCALQNSAGDGVKTSGSVGFEVELVEIASSDILSCTRNGVRFDDVTRRCWVHDSYIYDSGAELVLCDSGGTYDDLMVDANVLEHTGTVQETAVGLFGASAATPNDRMHFCANSLIDGSVNGNYTSGLVFSDNVILGNPDNAATDPVVRLGSPVGLGMFNNSLVRPATAGVGRVLLIESQSSNPVERVRIANNEFQQYIVAPVCEINACVYLQFTGNQVENLNVAAVAQGLNMRTLVNECTGWIIAENVFAGGIGGSVFTDAISVNANPNNLGSMVVVGNAFEDATDAIQFTAGGGGAVTSAPIIQANSFVNVTTDINGFGGALSAVGACVGGNIGAGSPPDLTGNGTPEAAIAAPVGSTFRRRDGGAGTSLYVKESGTGNTGWVGK